MLTSAPQKKLTLKTKICASRNIVIKFNEKKTAIEIIAFNHTHLAKLVMGLEKEFALLDIPSGEYARFTTIQLIVDYVDKVQDSEIVCN
jgi:acyl carrier protein